eukprot:3803863-Rhodomonas_salina.1
MCEGSDQVATRREAAVGCDARDLRPQVVRLLPGERALRCDLGRQIAREEAPDALEESRRLVSV